ncbi:hypothetical protein CIK05_06400 [Bdellovibrio sp. qaytius]|nr:hypothetical protein CIK05_06400 [Bdellovibrio sp. qaytius]
MKFSLLITLLIFPILSCQSMSKNAKSTNPAAKKANSSIEAKQSVTKRGAVSPSAKQSAANPAIAQKSIYEELTGTKGMSAKQAPTRVLEMARDARWKRDYVSALKRYNTIIVKYPKSKEVRQAYLDKAELYREMGLTQQSKYNLEKAKK